MAPRPTASPARQRKNAASPAATKTSTPAKSANSMKSYEHNESAQIPGALVLSFMVSVQIVLFVFLRADPEYNGDIAAAALGTLEGGKQFFSAFSEDPTKASTGLIQSFVTEFQWQGAALFAGWFVWCVLWHSSLMPGRICQGPPTPGGIIPTYKINGLTMWVVTHFLFFVGHYQKLWDGAMLCDYMGSYLITSSLYGLVVSALIQVKARTNPTWPVDTRFGEIFNDLFLGSELHPRPSPDSLFDYKTFHNSYLGMGAWSLFAFSYMFRQLREFPEEGLSEGMFIALTLHLVYIIDFFYYEEWYLSTIDVAHDRLGFMLAWGDSNWLPFMYTLQERYLAYHPIRWHTPYFFAILGMGFLGYGIFRAVNWQKDTFRRTKGNCSFFDGPAKGLKVTYTTKDGKIRESSLLYSGFWGWSRHFNYVGDLILSTAMCLCCGFDSLYPYFYIVFMTILLIHRSYRDDKRCHAKYGKYWDEYKKLVPYYIFPGIY
eukprot:Clim_evm19s213 gene=Clim_evmTU19s213